MLGQEVLPSDEQPCTQSFCEVVPCSRLTRPVVHAIPSIDVYKVEDRNSYRELTLNEMQMAIQEEEGIAWYRLLWPSSADSETGEGRRFSVGAAGLDVSIIDSPGLNSDLFKTTSLLSKQADIDVVIFVVNAANHLTLSARDFLERAAREKDHIFVVVNKFEAIRNQDKCRRTILAQVAEVLPGTHAESEALVHFISAARHLAGQEEPAFMKLEACLRTFLLENRTKAKLLPVHTFLRRLLSDLNTLLAQNCERLEAESGAILTDLELVSPCYEQLIARDLPFRRALQETLETTGSRVYNQASESMQAVGREAVAQTTWPGIFGAFSFRRAVLQRVRTQLQVALQTVRQQTVDLTRTGLHQLHAVAVSHAAPVFTASREQMEDVGLDQSLLLDVDVREAVPDLAPWDIVDWSAAFGSGPVAWISTAGLGGAAAAIFGRFPTSALSLIEWTLPARRLGRLGPVVILGAALASALWLLDIEGMVRQRLRSHLEETLVQGAWLQRCAAQAESAARGSLLQASVGLIARFEEALGQQRRLRAQKDMEHRQCQTVLAHFRLQQSVLWRLEESVRELQI